MVSVGFLEPIERRFSGAVSRCNVFYFEGVVQCGDSLLDVLFSCLDSREAASREMGARKQEEHLWGLGHAARFCRSEITVVISPSHT